MSDYTECMKPWMSGGGADRKLRFCTGAKLCSGKADNEAAAKQLCLSEPPKKQATSAGGKAPGPCATNMATLAACAIRKIDWDAITQETFEEHLVKVLQECSCRPKKVKTAPAPVVTFPNPSNPVRPHWSRI